MSAAPFLTVFSIKSHIIPIVKHFMRTRRGRRAVVEYGRGAYTSIEVMTMGAIRMTELGCKEVINICDGARYGYVCDVEVCMEDARIVAIVVPGPCRPFGWFWRRQRYVIPWGSIVRIGDDIILVDHRIAAPPKPEKRTWFH